MPAAVCKTHQTSNIIPFSGAKGRPRHKSREAVQATAEMRIVLVEWRIRKGHEQDFLDYWSRREVIADRQGLIGEFLSRVATAADCPWSTWQLDSRWTTFVNVGMWRDAETFHQQIGWKISDNSMIMPFEAERRRRIFVAPERWRVGETNLPLSQHAQVL